MKTKYTQQEILLVTTSTFAQQEFSDISEDKLSKLSKQEKLEAALWQGLLNDMLPELVEKLPNGKKLYLQYIRHGASFLQLELSETLQLIDQHFSIDPYFFFPVLSQN